MTEILESVEWGDFLIGDLFEFHTSKKRFDANKVQVLEAGKYPYVVRTALNNGIKGFIDELPEFLNDGNTISFGQDTATMFYQKKPYFTGDKIKIMKAKFEKFNGRNAQFILPVMSKAFSLFSWGSSSFKVSELKNVKCQLPIQNGNLHLDFMENFVAELEAYLSAAGLKDYTLTADEEQALVVFESGEVEFIEYKVVDLFTVKNTNNILSRDITPNSGNTPYLSASRENNAVSAYISYQEDLIDKGNCIFIGGKTFVVTYQAEDFYSNDSHNLCLYLKEKEKVSKLNQLCMISCIEYSLGHKYSWGDSISNKKIQKDTIFLPTENGKPDYAYMQTLIAAIQKLVIKDVVRYADEKIAATKTITGQTT